MWYLLTQKELALGNYVICKTLIDKSIKLIDVYLKSHSLLTGKFYELKGDYY
jgi:hypothetical protein